MTTIGKQSQGQLWSRHYLTRIVPMEIPTGARPNATLFGLRGAWPGGSPNTIAWVSLTKVGRKVQSSQVFSRNSPFDPCSALPAQSHLLMSDTFFWATSRFLGTPMRIYMIVRRTTKYGLLIVIQYNNYRKKINAYSLKLVQTFLGGRVLLVQPFFFGISCVIYNNLGLSNL